MSKENYPSLDELKNMSTVSVESAAYLLGLSRQAGYNAANRGDLPVIKIGRRIRIKARLLHAMLTGPDTEADES